jgi:thiamine transport system permease protein
MSAITRVHPGSAAALALALLALVSLAALALAADDRATALGIGPYLRRVLAFSLSQAAASTVLSLLFGTALALALARRRFLGRDVALALLSTGAVMPAIVLVFAVIAVYGRSGWISALVAPVAGTPSFSIYGWPGVLLAHVLLNAPLTARILLDRLATVPAEHWRLAQSLDFRAADVFRHIDLPILRGELPGIAALVFLLCFTSFPIVLALGGGPSRATLEVAIFEALRLDLDFARAAWLALLQIALCAVPVAILAISAPRPVSGTTLRSSVHRSDSQGPWLKAADGLVLVAAALFLGPPLASVGAGVVHLPAILDADLGAAALTSLAIAAAAAIVACGAALALAAASRHARRVRRSPRLAAIHDGLPTLFLAVPPFALTAGLFVVLRRAADPATIGLILLPLLNGIAALPFAYRFIAPAMTVSGERYGRIADALGLTGWTRLKLADWPLLRRPLAAAFAMAMALSFGDFGIIALFGGELRTLPYLLNERLGAYRIEEAGALALVLLLTCLTLAFLATRWSDAAR